MMLVLPLAAQAGTMHVTDVMQVVSTDDDGDTPPGAGDDNQNGAIDDGSEDYDNVDCSTGSPVGGTDDIHDGNGDCKCQLSEAILAANSNIPIDTCHADGGFGLLGEDRIELQAEKTYGFTEIDNDPDDSSDLVCGECTGPNALPMIRSNIVINGNGATLIRSQIDTGDNFPNPMRAFYVDVTGTLTLNDMTVSKFTGSFDEECLLAFFGGAVLVANDATLGTFSSFNRVNFVDNGLPAKFFPDSDECLPGSLFGGAVAVFAASPLLQDCDLGDCIDVLGFCDVDPNDICADDTDCTSGSCLSIHGVCSGDTTQACLSSADCVKDNCCEDCCQFAPSFVEVSESKFIGNAAGFFGGALFGLPAATYTVSNSTFENNRAEFPECLLEGLGGGGSAGGCGLPPTFAFGSGGAIWLFHSALLMEQSALFNNQADEIGGGIVFNCSDAEIINTSCFDNEGKMGGCLASFPSCPEIPGFAGTVFDALSLLPVSTAGLPTVTQESLALLQQFLALSPPEVVLDSSTVTRNDASESGGGVLITNLQLSGLDVGNLSLSNTILDDNSALVGPDCEGPIETLGFNKFGNTDDCNVTLEPTDISGGAGLLPCDTSDPQPGRQFCEPGCFEDTLCGQNCQEGNTDCGDGVTDADGPDDDLATTEDNETCDDANHVHFDDCLNTCKVSQCGDGVLNLLGVEPSLAEECDDGNTTAGDGCSDTCLIEVCGDGDVIPGLEACDPPSGTDCSDTCQDETAVCGDGNVDTDEECDDGTPGNADTCLDNCRNARCGDGYVQTVEDCDDGNLDSSDGCKSDCTVNTCGDGVVAINALSDTTSIEQCDDGNSVNGDGCSDNCQFEPRTCDNDGTPGEDPDGDGNNEDCDDGGGNDDACTINCVPADCGDGYLQPLGADGNAGGGDDEECDDGNIIDGDTCSSTCQIWNCESSTTGQIYVCDQPGVGTCSPTCQDTEAVCGNGVVDKDEFCDDGTPGNNDFCLDNCQRPRCGDNFLQQGESCDDGCGGDGCDDTDDGDGCDQFCQQEFCGDGVVTGDETCDVSVAVDNGGNCPLFDQLSFNRGSDGECDIGAIEVFCEDPSVCGDGVIESPEECDDANVFNDDGCTNDCLLAFCGDGIVAIKAGEMCEEGVGPALPAGILCFQCQLIPTGGDQPKPCGDGVRDADGPNDTPGDEDDEECDDGNNNTGDGCNGLCKIESGPEGGFCGDGTEDPNEECDMGENLNSDAPNAPCREDCTLPFCGDGIVDNVLLGEECDSELCSCTADCKIAECPPECSIGRDVLQDPNRSYVDILNEFGFAEVEKCLQVTGGAKGDEFHSADGGGCSLILP